MKKLWKQNTKNWKYFIFLRSINEQVHAVFLLHNFVCKPWYKKKWILKFQIYPLSDPISCGYHVCLKKVSVSYNLKMFCFWNARIFWNMHNTSIKLLHIRVFTLFKNSWSIVGLGEKKTLQTTNHYGSGEYLYAPNIAFLKTQHNLISSNFFSITLWIVIQTCYFHP